MKEYDQVEHIFRHEYGQLVAILLRRVGVQYVDAVEDAVQHAMMQALDFWRRNATPNNPSAWLYQVAYRKLLSEFRVTKRRSELLAEQTDFVDLLVVHPKEIPLPGEMGDSLLRMLFVACDNGIPVESQLVFTLKSLCGFSIREVALRLFISEANVYKRFGRAKQFLKDQSISIDALKDSSLTTRLPMVHRILYLMFTEGYLSSHSEMAIRRDLCEEAIRLALVLSESSPGSVPETYALLALMYLHLARMDARKDQFGALLLLEHQDRGKWDAQHIKTGLRYLAESAEGDVLSRYHLEASIAVEHCLAASFAETRWHKIVELYELLERIAPSPLLSLSKAVAMAEWRNPEAGLLILKSSDLPSWQDRSYHWYAVKADLLYRCGQNKLASESARLSIKEAPTEDIKKLLRRRFSM